MLTLITTALAVTTAAPCPGTTTLQVNACFDARFKESDAILNRYFQAALRRALKESDGATAPKQLIQAERSWVAYRHAECGSVFDYWSGGTIRVTMELDCRIRLTRLRTYTIWRDWLTYPDSTPPLLPRPDVEAVTSER
jgi:uncharacterized protein YecT (DUF1311 family)